MSARQVERGAATLVVVMVMFLIVAMLAAYANRNLVFEQRVASNYVRSAVAHDATEAGLEWALALLNAGKLDGACLPAAEGTGSFRQRYWTLDPATGQFTPIALPKRIVANCVRFADGGWRCQCPASDATVSDPSVNTTGLPQPGFSLQLDTLTGARAGVVRVLAKGCSDSALSTCSELAQQGKANAMLLGQAQARVEAALLSALKVPPAAPLVSRLAITSSAGGLGLHNSDPRSGGLLMVTGDELPSLLESRLDSLPGTPALQALLGQDPLLRNLDLGQKPDAMFQLYFGMPSDSYRLQPAIKRVKCNGDCGQALSDAYAAGARMLWVDGELSLSGTVELGTDAEPLVLIAKGNVTLSGPVRFHGLLYARGDLSWSNGAGQALLSGAAIAEGRVAISGQVDFWYQTAIMDRLSKATGSFVRVPGSWTDLGS